VYKYGVIDDFDRNRCTFSGPLGFLFHYFARSHRVVAPQGSPRGYQRLAGNVQFGISEYQPIGEEHTENGYAQQLPANYNSQNHMLRIMVSIVLIMCAQCSYLFGTPYIKAK